MVTKGDIIEIDKNWSKIFLNGKWLKGKKLYQRTQGELEQLYDFIILRK